MTQPATRSRLSKRTRSAPARARGKARAPEPLDMEGADKSKKVWNLRLYIAGDTPKSRAALENLRRICDLHLPDQYTVEVVDLKTRPELAKADQILALPTLIRKIPEPMKRVIGDLSNAERALVSLELAGSARR